MLNLITNLDLSHKNCEFLLNGSPSYKTTFGGFLTVTSYMISIMIFGYFFKEAIDRNKPRVINNLSFRESPERIDFDKLDFIISHQNPTNFSWMLPTGDTFNLAGFSMGKDYNGTDFKIPFSMISCDKAKFSSENIKERLNKERDLTNALCIDKLDLKLKNLTLMTRGKFGTPGFSSIFFFFERCKTNCSEYGKEIMKRVYFTIDIIDNTYDNKNYKNPINPVVKKYFWLLESNNYKSAIFEINSLEFKDDIGFLFESYEETKSFQLAKSYSFTISEAKTTGYGSLSFQGGSDVIIILRTYMKIQEVLSLAGGISNFCVIISAIISKMYINSKFSYEIIDKLIKEKILNIEHLKVYFEVKENQMQIMNTSESENQIKDNSPLNQNLVFRKFNLVDIKKPDEDLNKLDKKLKIETSQINIIKEKKFSNNVELNKIFSKPKPTITDEIELNNREIKINEVAEYGFRNIVRIGFFNHLFSKFSKYCNSKIMKMNKVKEKIDSLLEISNYIDFITKSKFNKEEM